MRKIGIVLGSNLEYSPYVENYLSILKKNKINYSIIEYKKLKVNSFNHDKKRIYFHSSIAKKTKIKKIIEYYKFKKFCINEIKKGKYNQLIIFTPQLAMVLKRFLKKNFKKKYILDIRDYNIVCNIKFILKEVIDNSAETIISSSGFKNWLPKNKDYIIDHNFNYLKNSEKIKVEKGNSKKLKIFNIGSIRSFKENNWLINSLKNSKKIDLKYIGESKISDLLKKECEKTKISNIEFKGYYKKEDENFFYNDSDFINIMQTDNFLSKDAMPNRFYSALIHKKPIIATSDNLVGELVKNYKLGVVFDKNLKEKKIEKKIISFYQSYDRDNFLEQSEKLLLKYSKEKKIFEKRVEFFIKKTKRG